MNSVLRLLFFMTASMVACTVSAQGNLASAAAALPNAKPGECYAKVIIPAQYKAEEVEVVTRQAAQRIKVIPAEHRWVAEKMLVKQASKKLVALPAEYETVAETIEVGPAETIWVSAKTDNAPPASPALLAAAKAGGINLDAAKPGQCFHEHYQPIQYKTEPVQVLVKAASETVAVAPAQYEWVEERVMVKEASKKLIDVPAVYETATEQVLVTPATTVWKKGRGPVEKIDNTTGEIMCLVEVPAVYKTVTKRLVKTPATTQTVEIPAVYETRKVRKVVAEAQEKRAEVAAQYKTVNKRVKVADATFLWHEDSDSTHIGDRTGNRICLQEIPAKYVTVEQRKVTSPASFRSVEIPAEYKTIKVLKLASPAQEERIEIPAQTQKVVKQTKVTDERLEWKPVLCQTNMSAKIITDVQRALSKSGFSPGPIDGVIGTETMHAVDEYQRRKGLPRGGLTLTTLKALGVEI